MKKLLFFFVVLITICARAENNYPKNVTVTVDGTNIYIDYDLDEPTNKIVLRCNKSTSELQHVSVKGYNEREKGHNRIVYQPLYGQDKKVWKQDDCKFAVGAYNDNKYLDKLFPVENIELGMWADKFNLSGNAGSKYYRSQYGTFSTYQGKYFNEFTTGRSDALPPSWRDLGFKTRMTRPEALALIERLGLSVAENNKDKYIKAVCSDIEIVFLGRPPREKENDVAYEANRDAVYEWSFTARRGYGGHSQNYFFASSEPQDIFVADNPELAYYDEVERNVTDDGYPYFKLKKDLWVGVADLNMHTIITPDRYERIIGAGGMWIGVVSKPTGGHTATLMDREGKIVLDDFYDYFPFGTDGPVAVKKHGTDLMALFSRDGRQLTDFKYKFYEKYYCPEEKLVGAMMGNKLVFIDSEGKLVAKTPYFGLTQPFSGGYAVVSTDKENTRTNVIDRNFVPQVKEELLNKKNKNWRVKMSTEGLPPGYVFIEQYTEKEEMKNGKKTMVRDMNNNGIYCIATGKLVRPDMTEAGFLTNKPFFFRWLGNMLLAFSKDKYRESSGKEKEYEMLRAIYDLDLNPIVPVSYKFSGTVLNDRYVCFTDGTVTDKRQASVVIDLQTGKVVLKADVVQARNGLLAMLDPEAKGSYKYIILDKDLRQVVPWHVSSTGIPRDGLTEFSIDEEEMLRDSEGKFHYMHGHANPCMRATLEPAFTKSGHGIIVSSEGVVYGSMADAISLRNRIGYLLSPSTGNVKINDLSNYRGNKDYLRNIYGRAMLGDVSSILEMYRATGDEAYLDRAVALGNSYAKAIKGYKLLNTGQSERGRELLRQAAEGGERFALALEALDIAEEGRYEDAYEKFLALGDLLDARHEAGLAALAEAYALYDRDGEKCGYFEWVERAADCGVSLGQKWAGAVCSAKGDHQRAADYYSKAADQGDADAALCAAAEWLALKNHANRLKYLEQAAKDGIPGANMMLGKLYLDAPEGVERSPAKAFTWLSQAFTQGEASAAPLLKQISLPLATAALGEKKYRNAVRYASGYADVDSQNPESYEIMGMAYYALGDYKQSLESFNRQLALQPKNMECIDNIDRATKKYEEAETQRRLQERIDGLNKETEDALRSGDYGSAISVARQALSLAGDKAWPYAAMGMAYYYLRDYPTATEYCRQALAYESTNSRAKTYLEWSENAVQRQQQAQWAAQQQANKWQAIADLCNSTAQLMNAIGNATGGSRRSSGATRTTPTYRPAGGGSSGTTSSQRASSSASHKPKYSAADVQHRKAQQMAYDGYFNMLSSMKARVYPYSNGFTSAERTSIQSKMRQLRTEWNSKHPDLPIYKSDLEDWDGR